MGTPFGVRSWPWVMAHINCLYGLTFAKPSGKMSVTQWSYPCKNGSDKFLHQTRGYNVRTAICVESSAHRTLSGVLVLFEFTYASKFRVPPPSETNVGKL